MHAGIVQTGKQTCLEQLYFNIYSCVPRSLLITYLRRLFKVASPDRAGLGLLARRREAASR